MWKNPTLGGSGLPKRRYRASISCFCWLCSSEISFRCLEQERGGRAGGLPLWGKAGPPCRQAFNSTKPGGSKVKDTVQVQTSRIMTTEPYP